MNKLIDYSVFFVVFQNIVQFILYPVMQMLKRNSYAVKNERENLCNPIQTNDTNNNQSDDGANTDEIDNVSLEILWQPQNDTQITADVVFIHGLHGRSWCALLTHITYYVSRRLKQFLALQSMQPYHICAVLQT